MEYKNTGIVVNDQGEVQSKHTVFVAKTGYKVIKINSFFYYIHRMVAELYLPNVNNDCIVDHINNDKLDNRVENLRWCSKADNGKNKIIKNPYGVSGIYKIPDKYNEGEYVFKSTIGLGNKQIVLGYFKELEQAKQVRIEKEIELYGQFRPSINSLNKNIKVVIEQDDDELEKEFENLLKAQL